MTYFFYTCAVVVVFFYIFVLFSKVNLFPGFAMYQGEISFFNRNSGIVSAISLLIGIFSIPSIIKSLIPNPKLDEK